MRLKIEDLLREKPGIKAREIASKLGLERREVNVLLHGSDGRYRQDSDHGWSLAVSRLGISLPGKWVSADDFEQALFLGGNALGGPEKEVAIYLPQGCNPMIDCTARLLSLANQMAHIRKNVILDFTQSPMAHSYLDRAGFFDQLDARVEILPSRPTTSAALRYAGQSHTMVEFGEVDTTSNNEVLVNQLAETFVQQSSEDYAVTAVTIFGELIRNVAEHSKSPLIGFAGLQKYVQRFAGGRSHIQTVVSDSGVGIAATLRPALQTRYPVLHQRFGTANLNSDIGLVTEALTKGSISSSAGDGHGLGFKSSKELALKHRAIVTVRQETFCIRLNYVRGRLVRTAPMKDVGLLRGTHICLDFYVD
jgi:hypothetical protein